MEKCKVKDCNKNQNGYCKGQDSEFDKNECEAITSETQLHKTTISKGGIKVGYTISRVNTILVATEARRQSQERLSQTDEGLMDIVSEAINKSVDEGKYYCFIYKTLTERVICQLKFLGYKVMNESSQKDGEMYKIEW